MTRRQACAGVMAACDEYLRRSSRFPGYLTVPGPHGAPPSLGPANRALSAAWDSSYNTLYIYDYNLLQDYGSGIRVTIRAPFSR
jgi:hypothetical protein